MTDKYPTAGSHERFRRQLAATPDSQTRVGLQVRLHEEARAYLEKLNKAEEYEAVEHIGALASYITVARGQADYDRSRGRATHPFAEMRWLPAARGAVMAVGAECGLSTAFLQGSIFFDPARNHLLRKTGIIAYAFTEPRGVEIDYEYAAGIATSQIGFDVERYRAWHDRTKID
jgi:hypothetical protein